MNTILVVIDTLRRDYLGCYGNKAVKTPCLDDFAERSVVFDNAYLASSPCMPARREIVTGRYEFPFRGWGPLEPEDHDLPAALHAGQKLSMLITDHYHLFEHGSGNHHFHFDGWEFIRGQENDAWCIDPSIQPRFPAPERTKCHLRWAQYMRNTARWRDGNGVWKDERHTFCAQTFARAADWLAETPGLHEKGFFLSIDCFDPHEPFDPPPPYDTMYLDGPAPSERVRWPIYGKAERYTQDELADIRALYAGKVTLADRWFGHLMRRVKELGLLENTMILVTTDHGHMFGEHGMIGKPGAGHGDSTLYQCMAHIPLLVYHPDFKSQAGARRSALTQPVDYYPTVCEAMGVPRSGDAPPLHGKSLLALLGSAKEKVRDYACFGKFGEAIHVTDGAWTLAKWPPGEKNAPLDWHSQLPPQFIRPKKVHPFDGNRRCYPVEHERGPMRDGLWFLPEDYAQERNLIDEKPRERARLYGAIASFLTEVGAPAEQSQRLGIAKG